MGGDVGAFEGAAEGHGDVGADAGVAGAGVVDEGTEVGQGGGDGAVCVFLGEGFGCCGEY